MHSLESKALQQGYFYLDKDESCRRRFDLEKLHTTRRKEMSIADYDALMNPTTHKAVTAQQPRYFVRYSYLHRLQKTKYDFIPQELFETWLKHMETNYLEFDLLFVTKM